MSAQDPAGASAAIEAALVETVILALANLRLGLGWFGEAGAEGRGPSDAAVTLVLPLTDRSRGLQRLDDQLASVEEAARRVQHMLRAADGGRAAAGGAAGKTAGETAGGAPDDEAIGSATAGPILFIHRPL